MTAKKAAEIPVTPGSAKAAPPREFKAELALAGILGRIHQLKPGPSSAAGGEPFVMIPEGVNPCGLGEFLPRPVRKTGLAALATLNDFARYFKEHEQSESRVFVANPNTAQISFLAVFDYHEAGGQALAGWCRHRAQYTPVFTREWKMWAENDGRVMPQADFAWFVENALECIHSPAPAEMLEVCRHLVASKSVAFESGTNLATGDTQLTFVEETKGASKRGEFEIPNEFSIRLAVFEGSEPIYIPCRLLYRIDGGKLTMSYRRKGVDQLIQQIIIEMRANLADELGAEKIYLGSISPGA